MTDMNISGSEGTKTGFATNHSVPTYKRIWCQDMLEKAEDTSSQMIEPNMVISKDLRDAATIGHYTF